MKNKCTLLKISPLFYLILRFRDIITETKSIQEDSNIACCNICTMLGNDFHTSSKRKHEKTAYVSFLTQNYQKLYTILLKNTAWKFGESFLHRCLSFNRPRVYYNLNQISTRTSTFCYTYSKFFWNWTISFGLYPKLYIPSTINIWKKLLTKAIWADKKWAGFWQISLYIK